MTIAGQTCLINLELFETLLDVFHFLAIDILCWPVIKQLSLIESCSTKFNRVVKYSTGTLTSVSKKTCKYVSMKDCKFNFSILKDN